MRLVRRFLVGGHGDHGIGAGIAGMAGVGNRFGSRLGAHPDDRRDNAFLACARDLINCCPVDRMSFLGGERAELTGVDWSDDSVCAGFQAERERASQGCFVECAGISERGDRDCK